MLNWPCDRSPAGISPGAAQVRSICKSRTFTRCNGKLARRQLGPIRNELEDGNGTEESSNWSGYAVLGSSFTSARGSWVVPIAVCTGASGDEYAASWVGLDGYSSNSVEQTGTDFDCDGTTPSYYAWYEFYPNPSFEIASVPVSPGNLISLQWFTVMENLQSQSRTNPRENGLRRSPKSPRRSVLPQSGSPKHHAARLNQEMGFCR
jgi:hypothetical protein